MLDHQAKSSIAMMKKKTRPPLRRLTFELALVVVAKIAFLMLIWWLVFSPHPKPDASAAAIAHRFAPIATQLPKVK